MPFTPYHFGINGAVASIRPKHIDILSCIFANIVIDIQPFLVIYFGVNINLHGVSHTLIFAIIVCGIVFYIYGLLYKKIFKSDKRLYSFVIGGILGGVLHVILDALMYQDVNIFYPMSNVSINLPFVDYNIKVICYTGYLVFFIILLINFILKKLRIKERNKNE